MRKVLTLIRNLPWPAIATAAGVICFGSISPAFADAIGAVTETNCSGGGVTVNATAIVWSPPSLGGTAGCIDTSIGTDLTYSGGTVLPGDTGNLLNITAFFAGPVNDFMTFVGTSLDFVLTGLGPGSANTDCAGLAVGGSCSVAAGSPIVVTSLAGGNTGLSLAAFGTVTDGGVTNTWSGSFVTQLNETPAAFQTTMFEGGSVSGTQSAQFTVPVSPIPVSEPGAGSFVLTGILFLLVMRKRRVQGIHQAT
jgi:hypothetical protein